MSAKFTRTNCMVKGKYAKQSPRGVPGNVCPNACLIITQSSSHINVADNRIRAYKTWSYNDSVEYAILILQDCAQKLNADSIRMASGKPAPSKLKIYKISTLSLTQWLRLKK
ncbi:hypothetical protein CDAR_32671 [Caerostris darwini]|uniref:Uncharacterized protein n=1 Tax=Caerostris darwini TaxID=1538125 RepID=A0AAV4PHM5_9ARAC|nr:hypothetical protein CDAR_32671 [Caerostris darwini]